MLRYLYQCALRLHPDRFRRRFGDEMLSIFDREPKTVAQSLLLFDSLVSLTCQWLLRTEFRSEVSVASPHQPAAAGLPSFSTLDPFRPRTYAVIHGMVLSITLFCVMCFAIRYSWIRVLQMHIPEIAFDSYLAVHPAASPSELRGRPASSTERQTHPPSPFEDAGLISPHLQVDVMPVEADSRPISPVLQNSPDLSATGPRPLRLGPSLELSIEPFVGTYISKPPKVTISISIRAGSLTMRIDGQSQNALLPVSTTRFSVEGTDDTWVEFIPDSRGRIQQLDLIRNGQRIRAKRQ